MYTLSRAAHVRTNDSNEELLKSPSSRNRRHYRTSSYIDLLDERAEQANNGGQSGRVLDLSFEDVEGHSSSSCDESSFEETTHDKMIIDDITSAPSPIRQSTRSCVSSNQSTSTASCSSSIRSSPRISKKRQPKITGKQNTWPYSLHIHIYIRTFPMSLCNLPLMIDPLNRQYYLYL